MLRPLLKNKCMFASWLIREGNVSRKLGGRETWKIHCADILYSEASELCERLKEARVKVEEAE